MAALSVEELETDLTKYKLVLALAMYREELNDTAAHSDEWPSGFVTNLGDLDFAAETLIRSIWEELSRDEKHAFLRTAATVVREFLVKKEGSDGP